MKPRKKLLQAPLPKAPFMTEEEFLAEEERYSSYPKEPDYLKEFNALFSEFKMKLSSPKILNTEILELWSRELQLQNVCIYNQVIFKDKSGNIIPTLLISDNQIMDIFIAALSRDCKPISSAMWDNNNYIKSFLVKAENTPADSNRIEKIFLASSAFISDPQNFIEKVVQCIKNSDLRKNMLAKLEEKRKGLKLSIYQKFQMECLQNSAQQSKVFNSLPRVSTNAPQNEKYKLTVVKPLPSRFLNPSPLFSNYQNNAPTGNKRNYNAETIASDINKLARRQ